MTLRDALLDAWALLSPVECAGCAAADRSLCAECSGALVPDVATVSAVGGLGVASALRYELRVRRVILAFKEHDRTDVARALAVPLAHAVRAAIAASPCDGGIELALVPTSRAAYRRRGYDPVRLLVRGAGGRPARVLLAARAKGTQKALGLEQRHENLRGAFVAARRLDGRRFVIVDDILTSGATISEAARAIRTAGGEVVGAATMAFTPRLFPFRDIASSEDYRGAKGAQ
ncbi:MAG: ComF family protein [Rhodoglobus sp.]|nr:ComF family protein [Rhodoglobus sp.]